MKVMEEKVVFSMPGNELTAFKRRIRGEGLSVGVFLRMSIENYLKNSSGSRKMYSIPIERSVVSIPFLGSLKNEQGDYRDRAAEYVLGRRQ